VSDESSEKKSENGSGEGPNNSDNLSDQDIAKALAGYEEDFKDLDGFEADELKDVDPFESELEGILGNKAKAAVLITPLQQPELLSAFCVLAGVSAYCIGATQGAVAVLKDLEGSSPEGAAKDLTTVISGLSVVLAVNRADKLEAKLWINGEQGSDFAPPLLFMNVAEFVEDYMIGSTDLAGLKTSGLTIVDSGEMTRGEALKVIASHTKFRPGENGGTTGIVE
jgi:hypothetical protein